MRASSGVALVVTCLVAAGGCTSGPELDAPPAQAPDPPRAEAAAPAPPPRAPLDGRDFPDGVVALTWDDGPDAHSLELATFLARERVSATFFVVGEWEAGASEEPGDGDGVFQTGHRALPILRDLVALGHRLGNHTRHHALLDRARDDAVRAELGDEQRALDPLLTNELRLFRAPGGAWSASAARTVDADPFLRDLVGPVAWDVDRKDWEGSLYCRSDAPDVECEPAAPGRRRRLRAAVTAQRYLASIEARRKGIVLLHDRVGHVGSRYAVDVAKILVAALVKDGFVFAAPVLRFSPLSLRLRDPGDPTAPLRVIDVDGDGLGDLCEVPSRGGARCALAFVARSADGPPRTSFGAFRPEPRVTAEPAPDPTRARAALADADPDTIRLGDLDGDGTLDACGLAKDGVVCALAARGRAFTAPRTWLAAPGRLRDPARATSIALGDVTGDGRADLCLRDADGVRCAAAP